MYIAAVNKKKQGWQVSTIYVAARFLASSVNREHSHKSWKWDKWMSMSMSVVYVCEKRATTYSARNEPKHNNNNHNGSNNNIENKDENSSGFYIKH